MSAPPITVFDDVSALQDAAAEAIASLIRVTTQTRGVCRIALSGGSTPKRIYELLASKELDWSAVHWFWGDERNVPPDDDDSNYSMVADALLEPAEIPAENVHRVPIDDRETDDPETIGRQYEATLHEHFPDAVRPTWDLVLLGMGDDAHTASLFPYTKALGQTDRWFVENWVDKFDVYRYTLTAPAINSGREIWFLVSGANKAEAMRSVLDGSRDEESYPAQMIRPTKWFLTADAMPKR